MARVRNSINKKEIMWIVAFVLLVTVPFLNKPIHNDDIYVVTFAKHVVHNPFDAYSFDLDFVSGEESALVYADPLLVPFYLSFALKLFGESELILHLFFMVFTLIAAFSMYFLAKRFTKKPLLGTLLLIATPSFIVASNQLMPDLPVTAFMLLSLVLFLRGVDTRNHVFLLAGSFVAAVAFLTKYNAILLVCLLVCYVLLARRFSYLWYMLIPISIASIAALINFVQYGTTSFAASIFPWLLTGRAYSEGIVSWLATNLPLVITNLNNIGGATIFFVFLVVPFLKGKLPKILLGVSFLVSMALASVLFYISVSFASGQYTLLQLGHFTVFVTASLFFISMLVVFCLPVIKSAFVALFSGKLGTFLSKTNSRNTLFLLAWFFGVLLFNSTLAGGIPRYNLLLLAPLIFFFIQILSKHAAKAHIPVLLRTAVAFTLVLGLSVAYADYLFAHSYKDFADDYVFPEEGQVFVMAHEDIKYYLEERGAVYFRSNLDQVEAGDTIIRAELPGPGTFAEELEERLVLVDTVYTHTDFPLRTQNTDAHAGWYNYGAGFLPYSISQAPLDTITIYRVE